jgi:hypothetical protein
VDHSLDDGKLPIEEMSVREAHLVDGHEVGRTSRLVAIPEHPGLHEVSQLPVFRLLDVVQPGGIGLERGEVPCRDVWLQVTATLESGLEPRSESVEDF